MGALPLGRGLRLGLLLRRLLWLCLRNGRLLLRRLPWLCFRNGRLRRFCGRLHRGHGLLFGRGLRIRLCLLLGCQVGEGGLRRGQGVGGAARLAVHVSRHRVGQADLLLPGQRGHLLLGLGPGRRLLRRERGPALQLAHLAPQVSHLQVQGLGLVLEAVAGELHVGELLLEPHLVLAQPHDLAAQVCVPLPQVLVRLLQLPHLGHQVQLGGLELPGLLHLEPRGLGGHPLAPLLQRPGQCPALSEELVRVAHLERAHQLVEDLAQSRSDVPLSFYIELVSHGASI